MSKSIDKSDISRIMDVMDNNDRDNVIIATDEPEIIVIGESVSGIEAARQVIAAHDLGPVVFIDNPELPKREPLRDLSIEIIEPKRIFNPPETKIDRRKKQRQQNSNKKRGIFKYTK